MDRSTTSDALHRTVKLAMDTGEAASAADAYQLFAGYRLGIHVGSTVAHSETLQAALLTAVNTARRCFLGGVYVTGAVDADLRVPWRGTRTLREAVVDLQGRVVTQIPEDVPCVLLGDTQQSDYATSLVLRATFNGWNAGVCPADSGERLSEELEFTPAGVLCGALAVSEAFQHVRGRSPLAGRRAVGLSLWRPEPEISWLDVHDQGPVVKQLPASLWIIGLGHLGQAFLWTLGLLPYAKPEEVVLYLQDVDSLEKANVSTSALTTSQIVGEKKTRTMARWCEQRGFRTAVQERRFTDNFQVAADEPQVALCGVDNLAARAALEDVGFRHVLEAGLGNGPEEFLGLQIHSFPSALSARSRWSGNQPHTSSGTTAEMPAYRTLAASGQDECGLTMLAGRSVGAAFVGVTASALVVAELLRIAIGAHTYEVIDCTLRSLRRRVVAGPSARTPFNPGLTPARL